MAAGNERGESKPTCRSVAAQVSSPIESLRLEPDEQSSGTLVVYWDLIPVVNPTWFDDEEGSTHAPPMYWVALREAGVGGGQWPNADTRLRRVFQEGRSGGKVLDGLRGNTEYEVAVRTAYYGETKYVRATVRTLMNPARNVTVGFVDGDPERIKVSWDPPVDGSQVGCVVTVRKTHVNKRVGTRKLDVDAVGAAFDGLKAGWWYHVNVKAVGEDAVRSAVRTCYFKHGSEGSQNTTAAGIETASPAAGCAALATEWSRRPTREDLQWKG